MKESLAAEVIQILDHEAKAINNVKQYLDYEALNEAGKILVKLDGNLITIGIGKSGLIAKKIAATFTSVGTPSIFLHPIEALHGDMGIVKENDVILALSNSGETNELVNLIPFLKKRKAKIISIVGNKSSTLARRSDVVIHSFIDKEACPLNLAPTASTTVSLAIGDALAMAVMKVKGISKDEFAVNHPAGRLGKRLLLKVKDLMHSNEHNPLIIQDCKWPDIINRMTAFGLGAVNVVNEKGELMGVITDGDIRRSIQDIPWEKLEKIKSVDLMTKNPITVDQSENAYHALILMENRKSEISILPVVNDKGICVGLVRLHDLVKEGLA